MTHQALLVAINDYPEDSKLRKLHGAVQDIEVFKAWLATRPVASKEVDVRVVSLPTDKAVDLSLSKIAELLDTMRTNAKDGRENIPPAERLYLYFAGHGVSPRSSPEDWKNEAGFLSSDYNPTSWRYHLPLVSMTIGLAREHTYKEIVLVTDACRDDIGPETSNLPPPISFEPDFTRSPSNVFFARATRPDTKSYERDFGADIGYRGVFSRAITDGLTHMRRVDGQLTALMLKGYVRKRVAQLQREDWPQDPDIDFLEEGYEIVLSDKAAKTVPVELALPAEMVAQLGATDPPDIQLVRVTAEGYGDVAVLPEQTSVRFDLPCGNQQFFFYFNGGKEDVDVAVYILNPEGVVYDVSFDTSGVQLTER